MGIDKFNHEGYSDPTTYEALTNIHREEIIAVLLRYKITKKRLLCCNLFFVIRFL